jgi:hypothetical protein
VSPTCPDLPFVDATSSSTSNADLLDILEHPNPDRTPTSESSSSVARITAYLVPFVEDGALSLPQDDHPRDKAIRQCFGEVSDDEATRGNLTQ